MNDLRIGEVAKACGVSVDTIRHYERLRVIPEAHRDANGYRRYPQTAIAGVLMVRRALRIGFTLDELARIFKKRAAGQTPCGEVRALAVKKLDELEERIREMVAVREALASTIESWKQRLEATPAGELAHLLESLNDVERRTN
ncbi:MAG TPA: heavy metal-responsive transcriptional regulator [Thermoanaerobaculia bacterium]|nr:heavy metal-responsive transcriptional regulator [Thermoanaerobaculia bacterium]